MLTEINISASKFMVLSARFSLMSTNEQAANFTLPRSEVIKSKCMGTPWSHFINKIIIMVN